MTLHVILDKGTDRVKSFVDGDINTITMAPVQYAVEIDVVPNLEYPSHYYKYVDGNFVYDEGFAQEEYARTWRRKRAAEYPPIADYLDGIVKGDDAQVQTYIDACLAVKAKYPKP